MAKQTVVRKRTSTSSRNYTGRQQETAARTSRKDAQERAAKETVEAAEEERDAVNSVFDPQTGERLEGPRPSRVATVVDEDDDDLEDDEEDDETLTLGDEDDEDEGDATFGHQPDEPFFSGHETDEEIAPVLAKRRERRPVRRNRVRNPYARIRIDQDVEDMTYGMVNGEPNNYTFREGLAYQVPIEVAEHLDERGLVRQWIG